LAHIFSESFAAMGMSIKGFLLFGVTFSNLISICVTVPKQHLVSSVIWLRMLEAYTERQPEIERVSLHLPKENL
jgi:hypothetical protein